MAEEKTATPRAARAASKPEVVDGAGVPSTDRAAERPKAADPAAVLPNLRDYIAYRRAEIHRPRFGGNIGGAPAIRAAQVESVLAEFELMADWFDAGCPKPSTVLSEADKDFYRAAVARKMPVPEEILRQL